MKKVVLVNLFSLMVFLGFVSCCTPKANPQPISELPILVKNSVVSWLDVRVDRESYQLLRAPEAGWREATSVSDLVEWFPRHMGSESLWNFKLVVEYIRKSEIFKTNEPDENQFLDLLKSVLHEYRYLEEDE